MLHVPRRTLHPLVNALGVFLNTSSSMRGLSRGVNLRTKINATSLTLEMFGSYIRMKAGTRRLTVQCEHGSVRSVRAARRVHLRCPGAFELRRACKQVFDWSTRCQRLESLCSYVSIIL